MRATYVWIDADRRFREKSRVVDDEVLPTWSFDGSSTGQSQGRITEVQLVPFFIFDDPFISGAKIAMCDCYNYDD